MNNAIENLGKAISDAFSQVDMVGIGQKNSTTNETTILNGTSTNATDAAFSGKKPAATLEGLLTAYSGLLVMALVPIYFGAFKSVRFLEKNKKEDQKPERMTKKDAMMFPVIASGALFGLYLLFYFFGKEHINFLLASYFFILGILALSTFLSPLVHCISFIPNTAPYKLLLSKGGATPAETVSYLDLSFDYKDMIAFGLSCLCGVWYIMKKHWIANNLFGLAFSFNAIEILQLNTVSTGCILLGGLFFYDIFWVFGSNVMVFVAKSFDAPIKLIFPQDLLEKGFGANNFAMLGLGDIVIPGIFVALMLRLDMHLREKRGRTGTFYFSTTFLAYFVGLLSTIVVMHVFKHAQPALLYLVPTCLGFPIIAALLRGDIRDMFSYEDHPPKPEVTESDATSAVDSGHKKTE